MYRKCVSGSVKESKQVREQDAYPPYGWVGGSYNCVQHPAPFSREGNITVADCMPLSSLLKTIKTNGGVE